MASITAKINASTGSGPKKVSVTLPSGTSLQNSSLSLKLLGDVDVTSLNDGALLQYRASDGKFVSRNEIVTTTGTLTFNGYAGNKAKGGVELTDMQMFSFENGSFFVRGGNQDVRLASGDSDINQNGTKFGCFAFGGDMFSIA